MADGPAARITVTRTVRAEAARSRPGGGGAGGRRCARSPVDSAARTLPDSYRPSPAVTLTVTRPGVLGRARSQISVSSPARPGLDLGLEARCQVLNSITI
jgi:hypothetical protein